MRFRWPLVWRSTCEKRLDNLRRLSLCAARKRNDECSRRTAIEAELARKDGKIAALIGEIERGEIERAKELDRLKNPPPFDFACPLPGWLSTAITFDPARFEATVGGMGKGEASDDPRVNLNRPMGLSACSRISLPSRPSGSPSPSC